MYYLMLSLMVWAASFTGLPVPDTMPTIHMTTNQKIFEHVRPNQEYKEDSGFTVRALYDHDTSTIWLNENWNPDNLVDLSIMLHELIHHMQYESGNEYECHAAMEKEAYAAQIAWVEAAGEDPWKLLNMNALFVFYVTTCDVL